MDNKQARDFLNLIRKELNTKAILLDWGNRNFGAVKVIEEPSEMDSDLESVDNGDRASSVRYSLDYQWHS